MEKVFKFSLDDIKDFENDESVDFAYAKLRFLASGNNSHRNPISEEVLRKYAHTVLGKFVVAKFDKYRNDVTTHVPDEAIIGYIPPNSEITFEKDEIYNKTFAVCEAIISKIYATSVYKLFKEENRRNVSSEFSAITERKEVPGVPNKEDNPILEFNLHGVTVLGLKYKPSVQGADMKMMKFSEEEANKFYDETHSAIKLFAEGRKKNTGEITYKVNKEELKENPWGEVDKTELRNKVLEAKNKKSLVKDVYALVEEGWEEAPSEHLKYPIMELVGDTFYYNRHALSSALGYAKKEDEKEVVSKIEKLYEKFNLNEKEEEEKMADENKKPEDVKTSPEEEKAKKMSDEEPEHEDEHDEEHPEGKDGDDEGHEGEDDGEKGHEEKEFSLDANLDVVAYNAMLESGAEKYRELAKEYVGTKDALSLVRRFIEMAKEKDDIIMQYEAVKKECESLKEYKENKEMEEMKFAVKSFMGEVKEDLPEDKFEEFMEKGLSCKMEEIDGFKNTVKAFAYECKKSNPKQPKKERTSYRFGLNEEKGKEVKTVDDIYNKYL